MLVLQSPPAIRALGYSKAAMLIAAVWHKLPLLNFFIDQYNGDLSQKNHSGNTIFYIAFMAGTIQKPEDIHYLNNLNHASKKQRRELRKKIMTDWIGSKSRKICCYRIHIHAEKKKLENFLAPRNCS